MPAGEHEGLRVLIDEAQRVLAICNACRYCEGYCAVFPALERRLAFTESDVHYLAHLCHNCGACLYACQYAPPHAFDLNFPRLLAQVRKASYRRYAWPRTLGFAFERNGLVVTAAAVVSIALVALVAVLSRGGAALVTAHPDTQGAFYAAIPHGVMAGLFGVVFALAMVACLVPVLHLWRDTGERRRDLLHPRGLGPASADAATLRYLDGGGEGCTYPTDRPSFARRNFHHLTFYGFALCFAATVVATIDHYAFGWEAPYRFISVPVILGTLGGLGLALGPVGLLWLRRRRDPALGDPRAGGLDTAFLALLPAVSISGLALLAARETSWMGTWLVLHLGTVMAFFVTMPYGKFVHAPYRLAALARFHLERRRPLPGIAAE